jgi:hypothetical protein
MLVIAANPHDEVARWLAARWQACGVALLTPAGLSVSGWRHYFPSSDRSRVILDGREVAACEVTGVLTRMPCVYEQELGHIVPADRSYVAAEMTAFLLAWLSSLACPVLNRPTPNCLAGPNWRTEQWIHRAAGLGIPVRPLRRTSPCNCDEPDPPSDCELTVVGDRCFGDSAPELSAHARLLARAAGVELLSVRFTGRDADGRFVSASLWPNLASPEVADAVLSRLLGSSPC